ncbi:VCBS domain-containing protein, partial [Chitinimonas sp. PSY-7]|uniref:VCBS domain-containing protein n=1 Tax=Chitinimonas sp. PSY-7 TaxID=3459088 RepID=UPI00403FEC4A
VGSVTEDAATPTLTDSGTLTISDADTGQASFQTTGITASAGALGSLSITSAGTWTYNVANSAVQYLKAGETKLETFTVLSTDGTPHEIKVTITGTNDTAVISGVSTGEVQEDGALSISGKLQVHDVDNGEAVFQKPASLTGTYGNFTFNDLNGQWSYTADNSKIQFLGDREQVTETLVVHSKDGTATQNIVVTINGLNDVAVIGAGAGDSNKGVVVEDTTLVS